MHTQHLLLTLGHNSSAAVVRTAQGSDEAKIIGAYEQERIDRIKSSSAFPKDAIIRLIDEGSLDPEKPTRIYISHWFDTIDYDSIVATKYYDETFMLSVLHHEDNELITLDVDTSHHDAHAYSVVSFADDHGYKTAEVDPYIIVADGFGNFQEVISIYRMHQGQIKLVERIRGYDQSLGLMYQFATAFCGMKENQDEYKFLGYESHIKDVLKDNEITDLNYVIQNEVTEFVSRLESPKARQVFGRHLDELGFSATMPINIEALKHARRTFGAMFERIQKSVFKGFAVGPQLTQHNQRVVIGYAVQAILEDIVSHYIDKYKMRNVLTCGGVFYNVKLNNTVLNFIGGLYCTNPLNGDQGAAFGLFTKHNPDIKLQLRNFIFGKKAHPKFNVFTLENKIDPKYKDTMQFISQHTSDKLSDLIGQNCIVNMVRSGHEFGPRALCHTTTLALPFKRNAEKINKLNDRNEVMPMAPVVLQEQISSLFKAKEYNRVVGSDKYMIITYTVREDSHYFGDIEGVIHKHPVNGTYTARPQVVTKESDPFMFRVMSNLDKSILINTSFNYHGEPIILTYENAITTHEKQCAKADELGIERPHLVIIF